MRRTLCHQVSETEGIVGPMFVSLRRFAYHLCLSYASICMTSNWVQSGDIHDSFSLPGIGSFIRRLDLAAKNRIQGSRACSTVSIAVQKNGWAGGASEERLLQCRQLLQV